jgi:orotate phosphoribosyltransferase
MGGLIIGQETAAALGVRHYFAERVDGALVLRRGFGVASGERVFVVEDVVTTGKSTREVLELVAAAGGKPVGAVSIVDRSEGRAARGVPYAALWAVRVPAWAAAECPRCRAGEPVVKPGSRTEKKNVP